jgi:hypothetical protein
MKYDFMRRHTEQFSLAGMCRALSASRSGYYAWCHREPSAHQRGDMVLAAHVRRIHAARAKPTAHARCGKRWWPRGSRAVATASPE